MRYRHDYSGYLGLGQCLPRGATLATYVYLVTMAINIGYFFHLSSNIHLEFYVNSSVR